MNMTQLAILELRAQQRQRARAQAYYEKFLGVETNERQMVHCPKQRQLGEDSREHIREPEMVSGASEGQPPHRGSAQVGNEGMAPQL